MFHTSLVPACPVVDTCAIRDAKTIPGNCCRRAPLLILPLTTFCSTWALAYTARSLSACFAPGVAALAVRCSCGRTALFLPRVLLHAHGTSGTQTVPCNCCMCASSLHLWLGKFLFTFSASFTPRSYCLLLLDMIIITMTNNNNNNNNNNSIIMMIIIITIKANMYVLHWGGRHEP